MNGEDRGRQLTKRDLGAYAMVPNFIYGITGQIVNGLMAGAIKP